MEGDEDFDLWLDVRFNMLYVNVEILSVPYQMKSIDIQ